jgi:hypothetical protein
LRSNPLANRLQKGGQHQDQIASLADARCSVERPARSVTPDGPGDPKRLRSGRINGADVIAIELIDPTTTRPWSAFCGRQKRASFHPASFRPQPCSTAVCCGIHQAQPNQGAAMTAPGFGACPRILYDLLGGILIWWSCSYC